MIPARFKIGDFSQLGQVSVRTLRLYDELNLIKPAETDPWTGYRYYTLDQLPRLNRILALKDLGLSLEQIAQLLKHDLPAGQMREMLNRKQNELAQQLQDTQTQIQRVQARLRQIENENTPPSYEVALKRVEPLAVATIRLTVPHVSEMGAYRVKVMAEFYTTLAVAHVEPADPEVMIYHMSEYREENLDTEMGSAVEPEILKKLQQLERIQFRELPAFPTVATVIHHGNIWDIPDAIVALYSWVGRNGMQSAGPYRELHHGWRECQTPLEILSHSVTLEIQLPVVPLSD